MIKHHRIPLRLLSEENEEIEIVNEIEHTKRHIAIGEILRKGGFVTHLVIANWIRYRPGDPVRLDAIVDVLSGEIKIGLPSRYYSYQCINAIEVFDRGAIWRKDIQPL